jgi:hypothetical protein
MYAYISNPQSHIYIEAKLYGCHPRGNRLTATVTTIAALTALFTTAHSPIS